MTDKKTATSRRGVLKGAAVATGARRVGLQLGQGPIQIGDKAGVEGVVQGRPVHSQARDRSVVQAQQGGVHRGAVRAVQANVNDTGWARTTARVR